MHEIEESRLANFWPMEPQTNINTDNIQAPGYNIQTFNTLYVGHRAMCC